MKRDYSELGLLICYVADAGLLNKYIRFDVFFFRNWTTSAKKPTFRG